MLKSVGSDRPWLGERRSSAQLPALSWFLAFGGFDRRGEGAQGLFPHRLEDVAIGPEGVLVGPVDPVVAFLPYRDEVGLAKHRQVLGDGAKGHVELGGDFTRSQLPIPDQSQDLTTLRFGDYLKSVHPIYFRQS